MGRRRPRLAGVRVRLGFEAGAGDQSARGVFAADSALGSRDLAVTIHRLVGSRRMEERVGEE